MEIHAIKKNNGKIIFNLPDKTEQEAITYAQKTNKKLTRERFNKCLWGWKYKVQ